jgi:1-acyl-sn-glycerol-3-phosphate acyltransferase
MMPKETPEYLQEAEMGSKPAWWARALGGVSMALGAVSLGVSAVGWSLQASEEGTRRALAARKHKVDPGEVVPVHDWVYHLMFGLYSVYFRIGGWRIHGRENVPMQGPVIIAPNHKSLLDPPLVGSTLPRLATTMGKVELFEKEHFGLRVLGKVIQHMGTFPVKRFSADRRAIRRALQVLADDGALVIFPEGTRTRDGELGASELGIAHIAHKSKAPVVPAYLKGTEGCFSYMEPRARMTQCEIFYGKPVFFEREYAQRGDRATLEAIASRIMDEIALLKKAAGD